MVRSDDAPSSAGACDSTGSGAPSPREILLPGARRPFAHGASAAGDRRPFRNISGGQGASGAGVRSPFVAPGRSHSPTAPGHFSSSPTGTFGTSPSLSDLLNSEGFMSFMMDDQQRRLPENAHLVGAASHVTGVNVESANENEEVRREPRLIWKQEEDVRVMSAWLKHSLDSISGNNKKGDKYWDDVAKEYNLTTVKARWRTRTQVKERWHKINKWTTMFNDCWLKARRVFTSGYSDQMWMDKAHKFYQDENKGSHFVLVDVWNIVKNEAKWISYNSNLQSNSNQKNKRKERDNANTTEGDAGEDFDLPRPIGQKAAKKIAREGKGKSKGNAIDVDEFDRFEKVQNDCNANRLKILEKQEKINNDKLEAKKIARETAKDQKEAKLLEKEARMLETYTCLLQKDVSTMPEDVRAEHVAALKSLRKILFPDSA